MNGTFPPPELPSGNTLHIWLIELDQPPAPGIVPAGILSGEERERAGRFVFARDAQRFRLCRAMLRLGLGWYLQRDPREIAIWTGRFGKPYLGEAAHGEAEALTFNVAHTGGLAAIAFSTLGEVGIDVEATDRGVEAMEIASAYFTANETAMIAAAGRADGQIGAFLRLWVRKEAVLKAAGCGLQAGLDTVDVTQPLARLGAPGAVRGEGGSSDWQVVDLRVAEGFAGAVAAPVGEWSVLQWMVGCEDAFARFRNQFPKLL